MADAAYGQESVAFPEKRGLFLQLERLSNILCTSSDGTRSAEGWEQHRWALQQISLLVQSDISNCSEFLAFMRVFLRVPLQRHIEELRTVLCVEACNVVRSLAVHSTNRHAWQVATEWFVPSLLKLAARKGGTVVRAASETLSTLVKTSSFGPGALGELFRGCSASHAATRSLSFSVLKLLIQCTQNNEGVLPLSRYRADICRLLRAGMSDASEQTRACARDCYMTLLAAEHEIASALYRELDTSVKRALGRQQDGVPTGVHDTRRGLGEAHSCEALVTDCASSLPVMNQMESHGVPLGGGKEKTNEASVDDPSRVCAPDAADDDCCEVREMLMSPSWINRLQGARIIIRDLPRTKCKDKHAKLVIPLLCDPDSRVARVVVESLPLLSRLVPEAVKADLPRITSSLLAIISKGSGSAVCAARKQLVSAGKLFPIPVILGAVYRLLRDGDAPATLKARALEYATYLYTSNTRLMHQLAPMKQAIAQVLRVLQNCNKDDLVHQAGVTSLTALYSEAKDAFLRVLLEHLSAEERNVAFGALEVAIPHLIQESHRMRARGAPTSASGAAHTDTT
uniref:CLASP N-terminal domain-containing protein n=1 Tax=Trypanosoma vivax (strain Y486) TaxID=1055687 RepID=G0U8T7_TRYVY|nr:conserved hypothetical protein [Trypanosoma vivax Y486]